MQLIFLQRLTVGSRGTALLERQIHPLAFARWQDVGCDLLNNSRRTP